MVRWVFFDVGNILLDEDPLTYRNFCFHVAAIRQVHRDRTFLDLLAEREARALSSRWPLFEVASRYLDADHVAAVWNDAERAVRADFASFSPPVAGAAELIAQLAGRYRLGLIANQGAECRARLAALGWLDRFEAIAFSEEQGVSKPDPGLFRRVLECAGIAADEALMVGDRLDNDMAPAAALGMATAWVRWPRRAAKGWPVQADPDALAYLASLERSSARDQARSQVAPTLAVDTIAELGKRFNRS